MPILTFSIEPGVDLKKIEIDVGNALKVPATKSAEGRANIKVLSKASPKGKRASPVTGRFQMYEGLRIGTVVASPAEAKRLKERLAGISGVTRVVVDQSGLTLASGGGMETPKVLQQRPRRKAPDL